MNTTNTTENTDTTEKTANLLTLLLMAGGVPGALARIIAAALAAAIITFASLAETSCTTAYTKGADGTVSYNSSLEALPTELIKELLKNEPTK